jgi:transcriptional regulator with XRE-family HTH domain
MLPQELRIRRDRLCLTQAELAAKLNVTVTTVSRWENGKQAIPGMVRTLMQLWEDEPLTPEEIERHNKYNMAKWAREDAEREAKATPEERERAERWFGNKRDNS